jgi:beta-galactosidase
VETTGEPAAIQLNPDRATINADGEDCAVITVAVTDTQGRPVPAAGNLVHFAINGPGKIIGVGNGDPSCHEPDQYAATNNIRSLALTNWRMKLVPNSQDCPEIASDFADSDWPAADVNSEQGPLAPDTSAVYREHVSIPTEALAGGAVLHVGMIDDNGWVYVNGQLAGESHDWQASPSFDVQKLLHPGENVIAVVVQNKDGSGGLNKGVNLELTNPPTAPVWQRSVFNGLAQIIVQSIRKAGDIRLTAHSDGLAETTTVIHAEPHSPRPALP